VLFRIHSILNRPFDVACGFPGEVPSHIVITTVNVTALSSLKSELSNPESPLLAASPLAIQEDKVYRAVNVQLLIVTPKG
jgi:hypothetical protein